MLPSRCPHPPCMNMEVMSALVPSPSTGHAAVTSHGRVPNT